MPWYTFLPKKGHESNHTRRMLRRAAGCPLADATFTEATNKHIDRPARLQGRGL
jgi:hypothetical protein